MECRIKGIYSCKKNRLSASSCHSKLEKKEFPLPDLSYELCAVQLYEVMKNMICFLQLHIVAGSFGCFQILVLQNK